MGFNRRMRTTACPVVWEGGGRNPRHSTLFMELPHLSCISILLLDSAEGRSAGESEPGGGTREENRGTGGDIICTVRRMKF